MHLEQVDGRRSSDATQATLRRPIVLPLDRGRRAAPRAGRAPPRHGRRRRRRLHRPQRRGLDRRRVRATCRAARRSTAPVVLTAVQAAGADALHVAHADRARGGRRGRGLGAVAVRRPTTPTASFNGVTELVVGQNAHLRYVGAPGARPRRRGSSAPSAPMVERDGDARLGRARLRLGATARCCLETKLAGPGVARARSPAPTPTRGRQHLDFDTLQEHAAPEHDLRPRLPRRSSAAARAPCGAG